MRQFGIASIMAVAATALGMLPVAATREAGMFAFENVPKKAARAVKRVRYAEPNGRVYRARNKPPKRKLHRNMVRHSRRVRRKHRRAA